MQTSNLHFQLQVSGFNREEMTKAGFKKNKYASVCFDNIAEIIDEILDDICADFDNYWFDFALEAEGKSIQEASQIFLKKYFTTNPKIKITSTNV